MMYTTIDNYRQLKDEFIKFDRDYYTGPEYEAIFNFYNDLGDDYNLDVVGISCDLDKKTWDELSEEFGYSDKDILLEELESMTTVLHYDKNNVLYFIY